MNRLLQLVGSAAPTRRGLPTTQRKPIPPALRLVLGLAALVYIGTLLLMLPFSATTRPLEFNNSLEGFEGGIPTDGFTLTIIGILLFVGGLGIPVVADLLAYRHGRHFSLHTRITLIVICFPIACGTVGLYFAEGHREVGVLSNTPPGERLLFSFFQAVASRSSGIVGISTFEDLTPASQVLLMTLILDHTRSGRDASRLYDRNIPLRPL